MKNLFKNIWEAPASTIAGGLVAAIGIAVASDIELPKMVVVALSALSAFLAVFDGPNKGGGHGVLPILFLVGSLVFLLPSCAVSLGADGKPRVSLDPVAVQNLAEEVSRRLVAGEEEVEIIPEK